MTPNAPRRRTAGACSIVQHACMHTTLTTHDTTPQQERVFSLAGRLYDGLARSTGDITREERMWAKLNREKIDKNKNRYPVYRIATGSAMAINRA
jgi:hypothetical protein